ncbi:hypothetical protein [Erwinia aphidicola]|uniref:Uncharacterized protein n=2 Tax=Erwinia aphidicola TaxID=68334 RepID=A0ABU8DKR5_ERWAP|nr:hypothetical protein [Erwinia aphidicola]MBD1375498.1 hypothetical protein [Erwinia aphidicola]
MSKADFTLLVRLLNKTACCVGAAAFFGKYPAFALPAATSGWCCSSVALFFVSAITFVSFLYCEAR